eukprot:g7348.t1
MAPRRHRYSLEISDESPSQGSSRTTTPSPTSSRTTPSSFFLPRSPADHHGSPGQTGAEVVRDAVDALAAVARHLFLVLRNSYRRVRRVLCFSTAAAVVTALGLVLAAYTGLWKWREVFPYSGALFDPTRDCRKVALWADETCGAPWAAPCFDRSRCRGGGAAGMGDGVGGGFSVYVHDEACSMRRSSDILKHRRDGEPELWEESADAVRRIAASRGLLVESPEDACIVFYSVPYNGECVSRTPTWRKGQNHLVLDLSDHSREKHRSLGDRAMFAEGNMRPCYFRYGYDIAVPLPAGSWFATLRDTAPQDRKYFATFKGSLYLSGNGLVERSAVLGLNGTSPDVVVVAKCQTRHGEQLYSWNKARCESLLEEYHEQSYGDLMNSTFALVPGGRSPATYRLGEVLSAGCIPVFVHENFVKPFPEKIAWDDFSFTFPAEEGDVILDKLRAVPVEKLQEMQQKALKVVDSFFGRRMDGIVNTTLDTEFKFCPSEQFSGDAYLQHGSCCTDLEEDAVEAKFLETSHLAPGGQLTAECADLYKQLVCIQCHSFSAHLFERLGSEFGLFDGMNLKQDFCEALLLACDNQIVFGGQAEYGMSYCQQHVGLDGDNYWSYPYTDPPTLEPGLNLVFPNVNPAEMPALIITTRLTPDGSEYWIAGLYGQVSRIPAADRNTNEITAVVDISATGILAVGLENGLIDLAFDPKFSENGFFYISHTVNLGTASDVQQHNRISRFIDVPGSPPETLATELIILTSAKKFNQLHSSGWLGFKPSAYRSPEIFNDLYWNSGDGGPSGDSTGASQNANNLLGSMMRISVPAVEGATTPGDVDSSAAPEVCAIGLRNPWRCSFDSLDDTLWCGDVGQSDVESIDVIECGKNYGWSLFEGSSCYAPNEGLVFGGVPNPACSESMDRSAFEFPVYQYCHWDYQSTNPVVTGGVDFCGDREIEGNSVIGGYIYRGSYFRDLLYGAYIFADFGARNVYFIRQNDNGVWVSGTIISDASVYVVSMTEDNNRVGCFADSATSRALVLASPELCGTGEQYMSPQARQSICASYCAATFPNAVFAGVEDGTDCYCGAAGEDFGKNGALNEASCATLCLANPGSTCGGLNAIEVYEFGAHDHVGCFKDSIEDRVLVRQRLDTLEMSVDVCSEHCSAKGSVYMALQYGKECWCSSDGMLDYARHGVGAVCDFPCLGNEFQIEEIALFKPILGEDDPARVAQDLFKLWWPSEYDAEYVGCFNDNLQDRVLSHRTRIDGLTTEMCRDYCSERDALFYATQYSKECWCGTSDIEGNYDRHGPGNCYMRCDGEQSATCGGDTTFSLFKYSDGEAR